ncbi:phosphatidate cytidylyltransferase [Sporosalibacterium faouarense]|uniref:phosphatidate cytidylyltransferase n=1 Tax=Sporosalibacterium faouarense TaxID=516123 RepID=UPI00141D6DA2|nr:phosphatidate cytidylyltransferase [Sporosalibacterium faouarense]MTI48027.1 phosphatidate cytidylyltransferase [Bacillota bacterium]
MKVRIISGIIGGILLATILVIGGVLLDIGVLIISIIGVYEFNNAIRQIDGMRTFPKINYLFALGLFALNLFNVNGHIQVLFFVYFITLLCLLVFNEKARIQDISMTLLGGIYIPFFLYHVTLLNGNILIWLVFVIAIATDTFALFVGVAFGKRKLAPKLSPKKTIEGSIGGIVASVIATFIFALIFKIDDIIMLCVLSFFTSILSQVGDLTASKIKRIAGIKDFGNIMPGHGGVLDRFDSILFTAPIVYYYMQYFL